MRIKENQIYMSSVGQLFLIQGKLPCFNYYRVEIGRAGAEFIECCVVSSEHIKNNLFYIGEL